MRWMVVVALCGAPGCTALPVDEQPPDPGVALFYESARCDELGEDPIATAGDGVMILERLIGEGGHIERHSATYTVDGDGDVHGDCDNFAPDQYTYDELRLWRAEEAEGGRADVEIGRYDGECGDAVVVPVPADAIVVAMACGVGAQCGRVDDIRRESGAVVASCDAARLSVRWVDGTEPLAPTRCDEEFAEWPGTDGAMVQAWWCDSAECTLGAIDRTPNATRSRGTCATSAPMLLVLEP